MKLNDKKQFYSLEEARKYLNISQVELSKKTGIIQADISRIERGIANPSISILKRLAESMGMNLKIIFELKWYIANESLKTEATQIFYNLGLDMSSAIRLFLNRVILEQGLPFPMELLDNEENDTIVRLCQV